MAKVTLTDEAVEDFKEVKAQSLKNFPATTTVYLHGMKMAIKVVANNDIGSDESADTWPGCNPGLIKVMTSTFYVIPLVSRLSASSIRREIPNC